MRDRRVAPHGAQNTSKRRSAIIGRMTRHAGYAVSQGIEWLVEEIFGRMKQWAASAERATGLDHTDLAGYLVATAYDSVRLSQLASSSDGAPATA
jgi:hypothetical protein